MSPFQRLQERNRQLEALLKQHNIPIPETATSNGTSKESGLRRLSLGLDSEDETDIGAKEAAAEIIARLTPDRSPAPSVFSPSRVNGTKPASEVRTAMRLE